MRELDYVITNPLGVHARPAAQLAQTCVSFKSQVTLTCNGKTASAGNVLDILGLHAKNGDNIKVTVEGPDEDDALEAVDKVLHEKFEEHAAVSVLKIAFFGTKDYDRTFFDQLSQEVGENTYNCDIHYFAARLTDETVALAKGYDAVCIFVNDDCDGSIEERFSYDSFPVGRDIDYGLGEGIYNEQSRHHQHDACIDSLP